MSIKKQWWVKVAVFKPSNMTGRHPDPKRMLQVCCYWSCHVVWQQMLTLSRAAVSTGSTLGSTFLQSVLIFSSSEGYRLQFSIPRAYFVYMVWHCTGQHCSSMYACNTVLCCNYFSSSSVVSHALSSSVVSHAFSALCFGKWMLYYSQISNND